MAEKTKEELTDYVVAVRKLISGSLRSCIHSHGPITIDYIPSATKRVMGTLKNHVDLVDRLTKEVEDLKRENESLRGKKNA